MSESEQIEKPLRQFYAEQGKVRGYVFAATRNYHVTEEILQSVAIVVAQKAATFEADRHSMTWFMGIARNNILKWYRSNQRDACNVRTKGSALNGTDLSTNCISSGSRRAACGTRVSPPSWRLPEPAGSGRYGNRTAGGSPARTTR